MCLVFASPSSFQLCFYSVTTSTVSVMPNEDPEAQDVFPTKFNMDILNFISFHCLLLSTSSNSFASSQCIGY